MEAKSATEPYVIRTDKILDQAHLAIDQTAYMDA
jgi:hypothetical protein